MEGMLVRRVLAALECDFTISYMKGTANIYANALSHKQTSTTEQSAATSSVPQQLPDLQQTKLLHDQLQSGMHSLGHSGVSNL